MTSDERGLRIDFPEGSRNGCETPVSDKTPSRVDYGISIPVNLSHPSVPIVIWRDRRCKECGQKLRPHQEMCSHDELCERLERE